MTFPSRLAHYTGLAAVASLFVTNTLPVWAYDNNANDNLVLYWGQNSYGATHSDTANFQKTLSYYCGSDSVTDAFPIAFLTVVDSQGGLPSIDVSNICNVNDNPSFPGTNLPICQFLADDIQECQSKGKIVTLSIGGATGGVSLTSDSQAVAFADTIWNLFLGGSSSTRPFGDAVLDGVDLDIEGGSSGSYPAFVNRIRSHAAGASKKYYVTAAPQCPFPDAYLSPVLNAAQFDAVYVQFYNNFCGLTNFNNPNAWNFAQWDDWAKNTSPNKNVKIFIGAPASPTAAGSGYVDASTLASIIRDTKSKYSSFGGVMMWDASQAYANGRYDIAVKNALTGGNVPVPTSPTSNPISTTTTTGPAPTSGSCASVSSWSSAVAYTGGSQVTYNGHLWTAKWWTQNDTPGGSAGVWTDNGACSSSRAALTISSDAASPSESDADVPSQGSSSVAAATSAPGDPTTFSVDNESTAIGSASEPSETESAQRRAFRFDRGRNE